jgi:hypothetical protein
LVGREAELWDHPNVFALVVLAHLVDTRTSTKEAIMPYVTAAYRWAREQAELAGVRNALTRFLKSRFKDEGAEFAASLPTDLSIEQLNALIDVAGREDLEAVRRALPQP